MLLHVGDIADHMLCRRRGHILIVSSLSGFVALPGQTAYSATKFALRGFADALQFEARPYSAWF